MSDRPVGLMDKASASGAGDSRFESWAGQITFQRMQLWGLEPAQGNAIGLASLSLDRPPPPPPHRTPAPLAASPQQDPDLQDVKKMNATRAMNSCTFLSDAGVVQDVAPITVGLRRRQHMSRAPAVPCVDGAKFLILQSVRQSHTGLVARQAWAGGVVLRVSSL